MTPSFGQQLTDQRDKDGSDLPVRVTIGQRSMVVKPGEVARCENPLGPYQLVLFHRRAYDEADVQATARAMPSAL